LTDATPEWCDPESNQEVTYAVVFSLGLFLLLVGQRWGILFIVVGIVLLIVGLVAVK